MNRRAWFWGMCLLLIGAGKGYAQENYLPPMNIPLLLSGNFGELRKSHFHSGLDIKTNGAEGVPVYAVQDGYVSRLKVSPYGYGKALYLDHPDGFTSVYAHLSGYNDSITAFLRTAQYALESFAVDLMPSPDRLPVKKGDLLGYSGNSGSSGGPHLHFELRETETERPVNPLILNYAIEDQADPILKGIRLYPLGDSSLVEGKNTDRKFSTSVSQGNCKLSYTAPIKVYGSVGVAFEAHDQLSGTANYCGVYKARLFANGKLVYEYAFDKLDFSQRRLIHAHRDYAGYRKEKTSYQRAFALPNNDLLIYGQLEQRGVLQFLTPGIQKMRLEVLDYKGNTSRLDFELLAENKSKPTGGAVLSADRGEERVQLFRFSEDNRYEDLHAHFHVPSGHLFDDAYMSFYRADTIKGGLCPVYQMGDADVPLYQPAQIGLKVRNLSDELRTKAVIVRLEGSRKSAIKPVIDGDWFKAAVTEMGRFTAMLDTLAPLATPYDFKRTMKGVRQFSFKISDELSGIESVNGWIDGKWCLLDFDAKTAKVTYEFDRTRILPGEHQFKLVVKDGAGNEKVYEAPFSW